MSPAMQPCRCPTCCRKAGAGRLLSAQRGQSEDAHLSSSDTSAAAAAARAEAAAAKHAEALASAVTEEPLSRCTTGTSRCRLWLPLAASSGRLPLAPLARR
eukprot:355498-Chlamydomonas_euryale.AAC.1